MTGMALSFRCRQLEGGGGGVRLCHVLYLAGELPYLRHVIVRQFGLVHQFVKKLMAKVPKFVRRGREAYFPVSNVYDLTGEDF